MGQTACRGETLDREILLQPLESFPEPGSASEGDRDDDEVHEVDEAGRKELSDHRRTAADADIAAVSGGGRLGEDVGREASTKWKLVPLSNSIGSRG